MSRARIRRRGRRSSSYPRFSLLPHFLRSRAEGGSKGRALPTRRSYGNTQCESGLGKRTVENSPQIRARFAPNCRGLFKTCQPSLTRLLFIYQCCKPFRRAAATDIGNCTCAARRWEYGKLQSLRAYGLEAPQTFLE